MNGAEQYIAKIIFRNRILEYKGQKFEDFFVSIMTKSNPDFQPVKAYGNIGDRKNDGFSRTTGEYYQVFAPETITKDKTINDAVNKLKADFKGLYQYWNNICPIKNYYFVINDRYDGIPAPIIEAAIELDTDPLYADTSIKIFSAKDLERVFDQLPSYEKQDIVGFIPDEILPVVEYNALNEAISYLLQTEVTRGSQDSLIVPDFDGKISFNNLSAVVSHHLVTGSYQEGLLTTYFNENPGVKEILQKSFHALYEDAKVNIPDTNENFEDSRFYYILEHACCKKTIPIQTSVLVLMAYYFSSCDIFEEPK